MAGMQDKQSELLAAGNDLTAQTNTHLDNIANKIGNSGPPVADFG